MTYLQRMNAYLCEEIKIVARNGRILKKRMEEALSFTLLLHRLELVSATANHVALPPFFVARQLERRTAVHPASPSVHFPKCVMCTPFFMFPMSAFVLTIAFNCFFAFLPVFVAKPTVHIL